LALSQTLKQTLSFCATEKVVHPQTHNGMLRYYFSWCLLYTLFFSPLLHSLQLLRNKRDREKIKKRKVERVCERWGGVRLRSKGLRTQATGKLHIPRGRTGSSRRQRKLVFFVMLKFPLSSLVPLERCTNTSAPPPRNYKDFFHFFIFAFLDSCFSFCFIKNSAE